MLAIAFGYLAAWVLAGALLALRTLWLDPAVVSASSGMYAGGDFIGTLFLGALFSLVPTWFLLRLLRGSERFWSFASRACLVWAALVPLLLIAWPWSARSGTGPGGPLSPALALLSAFTILRVVLSPGSLAAMLLAWWLCPPSAARRRFLPAIGLEACGLLGIAVFVARAVWSRLA